MSEDWTGDRGGNLWLLAKEEGNVMISEFRDRLWGNVLCWGWVRESGDFGVVGTGIDRLNRFIYYTVRFWDLVW